MSKVPHGFTSHFSTNTKHNLNPPSKKKKKKIFLTMTTDTTNDPTPPTLRDLAIQAATHAHLNSFTKAYPTGS